MSGFSAADEVFLVGAQWIVVVDSIEYSEDSMRHHRCVFSLVCAFASDTLPWQESIVCRGLTTTQDSLFRQSFYSSRTPSATTRHSKWKPYIQKPERIAQRLYPPPFFTQTHAQNGRQVHGPQTKEHACDIYVYIYLGDSCSSSVFIPSRRPNPPSVSSLRLLDSNQGHRVKQTSINPLRYQSASQHISPHK
jgi:hypothetical protein